MAVRKIKFLFEFAVQDIHKQQTPDLLVNGKSVPIVPQSGTLPITQGPNLNQLAPHSTFNPVSKSSLETGFGQTGLGPRQMLGQSPFGTSQTTMGLGQTGQIRTQQIIEQSGVAMAQIFNQSTGPKQVFGRAGIGTSQVIGQNGMGQPIQGTGQLLGQAGHVFNQTGVGSGQMLGQTNLATAQVVSQAALGDDKMFTPITLGSGQVMGQVTSLRTGQVIGQSNMIVGQGIGQSTTGTAQVMNPASLVRPVAPQFGLASGIVLTSGVVGTTVQPGLMVNHVQMAPASSANVKGPFTTQGSMELVTTDPNTMPILRPIGKLLYNFRSTLYFSCNLVNNKSLYSATRTSVRRLPVQADITC